MLKDRTEELWFSYGIDDDKTYVMGIEICGEDGVWPTGLCQNNRLDLKKTFYLLISHFNVSETKIYQTNENYIFWKISMCPEFMW